MEAFRTFQFGLTGYLNFTKWSKPLPALEGSLKGKKYVITGANSGIGLQAAKWAAKKDASVYLICRNQKRGTQAIQMIKKQTGNQDVNLILGEMGQKKVMNEVYRQLKQKVGKIDVFVHNAGCMLHKLQYNEDKVEKNFATNTFAVYYLTKLCLELFHEQTRIITVSSGGMLTQKLVVNDVYMENRDKYDGTKQYAKNKRQQVAMMEYFAQKYPNKGKFVTMHPGWADTDALRVAMPEFHQKMKDKLKSAQEGADTINYLSIAPFNQIKSGEFYHDRKISEKHLPISFTSYAKQEVEKLINILENLSKND